MMTSIEFFEKYGNLSVRLDSYSNNNFSFSTKFDNIRIVCKVIGCYDEWREYYDKSLRNEILIEDLDVYVARIYENFKEIELYVEME